MPSANPSQFALTTPGALRLYSTEELLKMPPPQWLVNNILTTGAQGSFNVLFGPSGVGKSFLALDMAMSVGAGIPWQSHATVKGLAVYVSAEGTAGLGQRAKAWLISKGLDPADSNIAWLMESVPIYNASEELDMLIARFDELHEQPALVIVDTLARCFFGDENETEDMSNFVKGVDRMRTECGCAVLAIHHTNVSEGRERGNTALRAAADTMIQVSPGAPGQAARGLPTQGLMTLACSKQKESSPFNKGVGKLIAVEGTKSVRVAIDWFDEGDEV